MIDNRMEEFWQTCASRLQQELTPQQFSAWIKPLAQVCQKSSMRLSVLKRQRSARLGFVLLWGRPQGAVLLLPERPLFYRRQGKLSTG
jgi:hypothetical protein